MTKFTKRSNFEALLTVVSTAVTDATELDRLTDFINHEIEQLDKRAASAKKYAKTKAKAEDALTESIVNVLTDEPQSTADIVAKVLAMEPECPITNQKATYRLSKLVEAGTVVRETKNVKTEGEKGSRRITFYSLPTETDAE